MKPHRISLVGKINDNGQLLISNMDELREFTKIWKGENVIMVAEVHPSGTSKALQGYYLNKIVPDFQAIFRNDTGEILSLEQTDLKIRSMSPTMMIEIPKEETNGFELERLRDIYELSSSEAVTFIEDIRIIASRDYHYEIDDPKRL